MIRPIPGRFMIATRAVTGAVVVAVGVTLAFVLSTDAIPGMQGHTAAASHASRVHQMAQRTRSDAAWKGVAAGREFCTPTPIGFIGSVRAGESSAASQALGSALLARVDDSVEGQLVVARTANGMSAAQLSSYFSNWTPVLSQSRNPQLLSCDMLLSDQPAAQPIIGAAVDAVAGKGYSPSSAALRASLLEVLISDNPLEPGTVIVTLMVPGAAYQPPNTPVLHHNSAYTAVVNTVSDTVTGVTQGGL